MGLMNYNKRWGQPTNKQKKALMKEIKNILLKKDNINSWLEYFDKMGVKKYSTNLSVSNALKKAVVNSKNKEYHRPNARKQRSRNKRRNHFKSEPAPSIDFSLKSAKLNITDSEVIEMHGELQGHNDWITAICTIYDSPNRIITASRDKSIIIWDLTSKKIHSMHSKTTNVVEGKMVKRLKGHNHFISDIDVSSDGNYVISASWDCLLKLFNTQSGKATTKFIGHKKDVLSVRFSPDNRKIISCGRDKSINLWNNVGELKQEIIGAHKGWISGIAFSPNVDDDVFVSGSYDKSIKVWMYNNERLQYVLKYELNNGHKACISAIAISPDGSLCASGDKYGTLCLWDIENGKLLSSISAATGGQQINCIRFSPNRYWACFAIGGSVEIWDLESKQNVGILRDSESLSDIRRRRHISTTSNICTCIQWSYDGKTLYSGYSSNKIRIWKLISPFDGLEDHQFAE